MVLVEDVKFDGKFLYQKVHNLSRRWWAVEDQNEAEYCKASTRKIEQGKEFGNFIINYDEIGRQN